ncbi:MAG: sigma-70 family RNA polymerase sigma factor [Ilumatobacteraceae bacterium]
MGRRTLNERIRDRDPDAYAELYDELGKAVYSLAFHALGNRPLAEEVVQLTFVKVWRSAEQLMVDRPLAPWVYTIARRTAIDVHRREARHATVDLDRDIAAVTDTFEDLWEIWEVRTAVDRLPDPERDVVRALHFDGLTMQGIADELGIPVGTVKSRSHRAYRKLATTLSHVRGATA